MNEFIVLKKYNEIGFAEEDLKRLISNNIEAYLENNSPAFDITFAYNTIQNEVELKVKQADFVKAKAILSESNKIPISEIPKDHYLYDFSNNELIEILKKKDEWSEFDITASKVILENRNIVIPQEELEQFETERIKELSKPEKSQLFWLVSAYLFAIMGGVLGILVGWVIWKQKRTLPNGNRIFIYRKIDRWHARNAMLIGLLMMMISIYYLGIVNTSPF